MRYLYAIPFLAMTLGACAVEADGESVEAAQSELVGGRAATEADYPATVYIGGCTGVKVGPRHFLTAAHCIDADTLSTLWVTPSNDMQNQVPLSVVSANNHPEYENCTSCTGDESMTDFGLKPDISLIVVNELTPSIPEAVIDPTLVVYGSDVTLAGYGCEGNGIPASRFKIGESQTIDPLRLDGSATTITGGYVTTFGPAIEPGRPALCPGDSGGPLYRTGTNLVVGINSLASGTSEGVVGNWFTRVDSQSRYDIYGWLTSLIEAEVESPCSSICENPTPITSTSFASGNLGTGERCFEATANFVSGNCGGFASSRTFAINGTPMTCNGTNWTLPARRNGGYCLHATAGNHPWAWFTTW